MRLNGMHRASSLTRALIPTYRKYVHVQYSLSAVCIYKQWNLSILDTLAVLSKFRIVVLSLKIFVLEFANYNM